MEISNSYVTGEFSSGNGSKTTLSFEKNVNYKVYAYSTEISSSVQIIVGTYKCDFKQYDHGYVGSDILTLNINEGMTFTGTTDEKITITTKGNSSGQENKLKVYVYLVIV